jgi:hypothetical protein
MTAQHFIVARQDSQWKISYHGTEQGPFSTKEEAIELAIRGAEEERAGGREVEVLVQDIESNFHRAWPMRDEQDDEELSTSV